MRNLKYLWTLLSLFLFVDLTYARYPTRECRAKIDYETYHIPYNANMWGLGGNVTGKTFWINSDLTISSGFTFINCRFIVEPGVKITLTGTGWKHFIDCNFYGCNGKWEGIVVPSGILRRVKILGSIIQDAKYGLKIESNLNTYLYVGESEFYNNHIGMYLTGYNQFDALYVWGNTFYGANQHLNYNPLPFTSVNAYGIKIDGYDEAHQFPFRIGTDTVNSTSPPNNVFKELYIAGIDAKYIELQVKNSEFRDMRRVDLYSYLPVEGTGIYFTTGTLDVGYYSPSFLPFRVSFKNLNYGIYLYEMGDGRTFGGIEGADFKQCAKWAIYCNFNDDENVIFALRNRFTQIQISSDHFYTPFNSYNGLGIVGSCEYVEFVENAMSSYVDLSTPPLPNYHVYLGGYIRQIEVNSNFFNNSVDGGNDIVALDAHLGNIRGNQHNPYVPNGIFEVSWLLGLLDCSNIKVHANDYFNEYAVDGIHLTGNMNVKYCDNYVDGPVNGVHALGSSSINLAKTRFYDCGRGIYLHRPTPSDPDPVIGQQFFKDNDWSWGVCSIIDAVNETVDPMNISGSEFRVVIGDTKNPVTISPSIWFQYYPTADPFNCATQLSPGLDPEAIAGFSWEQRYNWYRTILDRGVESDAEQEFMSSLSNTPIHALAALELKIRQGSEAVRQRYAQVDELDIALRAAYDSLYTITGQLGNDDPTGNVQDAIDEQTEIIRQITDQKVALFNEIRELATAFRSELNAGWSGIDTERIEESTYKDYLGLILFIYENGYSEESDAIAMSIAQHDARVYGHGARKAHYLLTDKHLMPYLAGLRSVCHDTHHEEFGTKVHPNATPVIENWTIHKSGLSEYNLVVDDSSVDKYYLYNISGNIVKSGAVSVGPNVVDVSGLATGMYFIRCSNSDTVSKLILN